MGDTSSSAGTGTRKARPRRVCYRCGGRAAIKRPKNLKLVCKECFYWLFEEEVHETIVAEELFVAGERVAIAASGGKDSTVLGHVMVVLNERHNYGLELCMLSVDEGIAGYRDDSLACVERERERHGIPLKIVSYKELYGWTMDEIVAAVGQRNNCTFCGVFRRQALDRGAMLIGVDKIVTGHNADDIAETVLMNLLRGDISRLQRCTATVTGADGDMPRSKPFMHAYEKEIVMYAYHKGLDYHSTECIYSLHAYRGFAREFLKELEAVRPSSITDIIHAGNQMMHVSSTVKKQTLGSCTRCGYMTSQKLCKACVLLEGLATGTARLALGRHGARAARVADKQQPPRGEEEEKKEAAACGDACECAEGSA